MFSSGRARYATDSFSKHRAGKATSSKSKRSFRDHSFSRKPTELDLSTSTRQTQATASVPNQRQLNSAIITIEIGSSPPRLFAAHIDVLNTSPYFQQALRSNYYNSSSHQLTLSTEIPEIFSCVLEFLYKGDYFPKLSYSAKRDVWSLEDTRDATSASVWIPSSSVQPGGMSPSLTYRHPSNPAAGTGALILKDTAIYCAGERFALPQLKKIALRKQGLQSGIPVATILASARYAYAHTPESDRHLRAHYLALIIRSRNTFKKSGTMQMEMGMTSPRLGSGDAGTGLWFDLFVAMCNHLDDMEKCVKSPR
ncbi:MAG: hypothetical protein M1828_002903 [Chrysothrix sp. TS-e1954]|nr:MAG: hypothetical protein M1828_002903 [Chrysothrix sp. TS-e1954]